MAARAIGEAFQRLAPGTPVDVNDPLARKFTSFPRLANLGLALAMRYGGKTYDEYWRKGSSGLVAWSARQPWVVRGVVSGDVAVATHVLTLRMALAHRERFGFPRKVYGVVTDFGLHGYWPLDSVDGYFLAAEEFRSELARRGYPTERAAACGIPLRLEFTGDEAWQPRRAGGPLRVLILAGGVYSGGYSTGVAWLRQVLERLPVGPAEVRFTIITGNRTGLLAELEAFARRTRFEVYPRGLVGDMAAVMGSPDARQIDGLGGADPLTSKVAIVSKFERPGVDVDYLFAQVSIDKAIVDTSPSCGNMLAGIGPYAIETGLVPARGETTSVMIYNVNTDSRIEAVVRTPGGIAAMRASTACRAPPRPCFSTSWTSSAPRPASCCPRAR